MKIDFCAREILLLTIISTVISGVCIRVYAQAETAGVPDINFGEELTMQEKNGFASFEGENMLENFYQAKEELPDEIPLISSSTVSGENIFFVSCEGDDNADGSESCPLATVTEALNRVSDLSDDEKAGGSVIYMRDGEYHLNDTINITANHTSEKSTLFISAYPGENVILTTKKSVPLSKAVRVAEDNTDTVTYSRINSNAIGKLYYIDYEDMGVSKIPYNRTFYINDIPMYISRYPNQGTDTVESVIKDGSYINEEGFTRTGLPMEWKPVSERPFKWKDTVDIHIFGRIANEWSLTDGIVYFDKYKKTVKSSSGSLTPNYSPVTTNFWGSIPSTYYYTNIFEELDAVGEWFADDEEKRFYFYMPESIDINSSDISFCNFSGFLVDVNGAVNTVINNIKIDGADKGINIQDSRNTLLQNVYINDLKSTAVNMYNTEKCGLLDSQIRDVKASSAVNISQSSEKNSQLLPRRNFLQNTYITNSHIAVTVSDSSGNVISHSLFENTSNNAITLNGAENIIEYNEFSGVVNKITDGGGIYIGGDINNRANTVRYNYFHDSRPERKNARAIYCDDCSEMNWVYGNIIKNFSHGIFLHSGDDSVVMDNVVIDADTYIRNSSDYAVQQSLMERYFFSDSPQFINGYVNNNIGNSDTWQKRYKGILKEKYEQVLSVKAGYNRDSDGMFEKIYNVLTKKNKASDYKNAEDVQAACNLVADTGCYYIGNTYVVAGKSYSNGYGPSSCGLYNEIDNGGRPKVIYNAYSYDVSEFVGNMGLITNPERETETPVIYLDKNTVIPIKSFTGISWSESDESSSYKLEIALDMDFNNIILSYVTGDNEYPVYKYIYDNDTGENILIKTVDYDFSTDTYYYARVKAVSLSKNGGSCVSDTVVFMLCSDEITRQDTELQPYFGDLSGKINIKGKLPEYILNNCDRQISLILYEKDDNIGFENSICHIAQINPEADGTFSYTFSGVITDKTRLRIRAGQDDITDELFSQSAQTVIEISLELNEQDLTTEKIISAAAKINNMFSVTDGCSVVIAAYDKNGNLIGCSKTDTGSVKVGETEEVKAEYKIAENTAEIKAFLWDISKMKPLTGAVKATLK